MQLLWKSLGLPACGRGLLSVEGSEQSRGAVCRGAGGGVEWRGRLGAPRRGGGFLQTPRMRSQWGVPVHCLRGLQGQTRPGIGF